MGRDDRRVVPPDNLQQLAERDPARDLVEIGQTIDQEVTLAGRDLRPREDLQAIGPRREIGQLVGRPLVVVIGDHHSVEPDRAARSIRTSGLMMLSGECRDVCK